MKKIFDEVVSLDKQCYEQFLLSEDILMEHAASELCSVIKENSIKGQTILFLCGPGNNGGDGLAAARMLHKDYNVYVYMPYSMKSKMARLQHKRYLAVGGIITEDIIESDIYVDALFGSGLTKELDSDICNIIKLINERNGKKISCDMPSGLGEEILSKEIFKANISVSMGALKLIFFEDFAKDYIGEIKVANLGVSREIYESSSNIFLLEEDDLQLPFRDIQNSNKGSFGHTSIVMGDKEGAAILAAISAFNFGSGLVSVITNNKNNIPPYIMTSSSLPKNTTSLVVGMGLGEYENIEELLYSSDMPMVIDADLFYKPFIKDLLNKKNNVILTPHPKEFASLLNICEIADVEVDNIQKNRFKWVREFMERFPNIALVLKGANSIIAYQGNTYVNTLGTNALSKGGSGDVLSGLIGSLLAQGYNTLDASITAVLAHSISARNIKQNDYSLNPLDISEGVKCL
ncbi:MAG: NAD(P)H-hydrate dehydratase [Sulfurospirillaceae bacterium]|nr:NAD(P)H-hydrate dehydratase [Sulfurospirillaceae bacterium]